MQVLFQTTFHFYKKLQGLPECKWSSSYVLNTVSLGQASHSSFLPETTNFSDLSNCRRRELEPSQPAELQESAPDTHGQSGNEEISRQEFGGWKTPGLWWVWTLKIPSAAADHFSQGQSTGKNGNPSTVLVFDKDAGWWELHCSPSFARYTLWFDPVFRYSWLISKCGLALF